ncbi:hypothetical protein BKA70DRAFT_1428213 [Coprinopsis sp. MPI-PUGE-AT-0042]|nr:hypothetical protein BKA70DRAFT_1428213 [Coprinopsis sp. MPI-PUGE-AT-0042]
MTGRASSQEDPMNIQIGSNDTQNQSKRGRNEFERDGYDSGESGSQVGDEDLIGVVNGRGESALGLGPRKRICRTDPLVHHGRHFGRTIQAFCHVQTLIKNGLSRSIQLRYGRIHEDDLTSSEKQEQRIYEQMLALSPGLEERLCNGSEQDIFHIAELIQKGSAGAWADDTKGLKGVILDWITPRGQSLQPPLMRNVKTDRGFYHPRTGELLCPIDLDWTNNEDALRSGSLIPAGDQWPLFLYRDFKFNPDDVWDGLFRSSLLVSAFKHIFTSPSSVDREPRATRSGNARIHGMKRVTIPSLAYVATQVRFALSSSPTFSRTDLVTDSERFYGSVIEAFTDPLYYNRVKLLLNWWDAQIFPVYTDRSKHPKKGSVLALMKAQIMNEGADRVNGATPRTRKPQGFQTQADSHA